MTSSEPLLEARGISKSFGTVQALSDVSFSVRPGEVHCLLGDNGAGKSTLIKILAGVVVPDDGTLLVGGRPERFGSPAEARGKGIATVFQDLGVVTVMPVYRNFFLGREPVRGHGPLRRFDLRRAKAIARHELHRIGIELDDVTRPILTLSGGQRQCVAIARAIYFGAKVLILDEPTSALGVKQSEIVLKYVLQARSRGVGVVFITHNVLHAMATGDVFTVLRRGQCGETLRRETIAVEQLEFLMAGGDESERLAERLAEERKTLGATDRP